MLVVCTLVVFAVFLPNFDLYYNILGINYILITFRNSFVLCVKKFIYLVDVKYIKSLAKCSETETLTTIQRCVFKRIPPAKL